MKIAILVEGETEVAFKDSLRKFLEPKLIGRMPRLAFRPQDGRLPKEGKLQRLVANLLRGRDAVDAVIALTDVYTGSDDFDDAADAKQQMRNWVGDEPRFHPHAAQYDFEAWLLPYWTTIQRLAEHNAQPPSGNPETVNHTKPPAKRIAELFQRGKCRTQYSKARDAKRILRDSDLMVAANACPELRLFLNTILRLCGGDEIS